MFFDQITFQFDEGGKKTNGITVTTQLLLNLLRDDQRFRIDVERWHANDVMKNRIDERRRRQTFHQRGMLIRFRTDENEIRFVRTIEKLFERADRTRVGRDVQRLFAQRNDFVRQTGR